jgi:hypothetical protein
MKRVITEADIIAARQRVAMDEAAGRQQDFADALLASEGLQPSHVETWLDATVNVHWCACVDVKPHEIACSTCGLPPYWTVPIDS